MGSQTAGAPVATAAHAPAPRDGARASHSRFVQRIRRRYPGELALLAPGLPDRAAIAALIERLQADGHALAAALRIARQVTLERLAVLDVEDGASLGEITRAMTELAEATLELALARTLVDQDARFGVPRDDAGARIDFWIVGMGKLGARELNVSSDIDLVYVYEADGQTDGAKPVSAHEYFSQVARGLYALIGDVTEDGFVFRVDLALRPNGNSGPPVTSLAMLEEYLQAHGREWERFAWLKSRVVAPRASVASGRALALKSLVTAFVYRRYLDYGVFEGLRQLHLQGARRGAAARRRPARARQRRQALARRHPRDRVHRPAAARRARRPVPRDPHALDAEGARQARRRRPDAARDRRAPRRRLHPAAPDRAPHPVPRRPADARPADQRRRPRLDRRQPRLLGRRRHLRDARPARRRARVGRARVRQAPARRPARERRQRLPQLRAGAAAGRRRGVPREPARRAARARRAALRAPEDQAAARREQGAPRAPDRRRGTRGRTKAAARSRRRCSSSTGSSRCCGARATWRCSPSDPRCRTGCCACSVWRAGRCAT